MKQTRYEQETIVNYNVGEQTATVYTRDKAVMRKLDTLVVGFPNTYKLTGQDEVSIFFPKIIRQLSQTEETKRRTEGTYKKHKQHLTRT